MGAGHPLKEAGDRVTACSTACDAAGKSGASSIIMLVFSLPS